MPGACSLDECLGRGVGEISFGLTNQMAGVWAVLLGGKAEVPYVKGKCIGVWRTGTLFVLQLSTSSEWITENSLSLPLICIAAKP
jgi:hypothetical protein